MEYTPRSISVLISLADLLYVSKWMAFTSANGWQIVSFKLTIWRLIYTRKELIS